MMDTPNEKGVSERQRIQASVRASLAHGDTQAQINLRFPSLVSPVVDLSIKYLIEDFENLSRSRPYTGMGDRLPITYEGILAYSTLTKWVPDTFELEALKLMDHTYLVEMRKLEKQREPQEQR